MNLNKYLGEFENKFEADLGEESGDLGCSFDEKNQMYNQMLHAFKVLIDRGEERAWNMEYIELSQAENLPEIC